MKYVKSLLITLLVGVLYFYFALPPINITSFSFWFFVIILIATFGITSFNAKGLIILKKEGLNYSIKPTKMNSIAKIIIGLIVAIFVGPIIINFFLSPLFLANAYSKRIDIDEEGLFKENVLALDIKSLPVIDKDSSIRLGDRVMGQMPDLVSQFEVSSLYTQINYKSDIVRVTPLEYSDFFKFFNNFKNGVAGYILVNSVSGEAELVRLKDGMKYMDSAFFNKKLDRKLRMEYPTKIFADKHFEVDDEGKPFWIVPTIKYVGVNIRAEVNGVIILDPITGDSTYYTTSNVPSWVDHAYSSELIIEQTNDWGKYKKGFWNSIIGQRNVVQTTRGYNYTVMNDDVYLYTGITSVTGDESNIGFIMTNLRTKKTNFYAAPGADEYSARASAEGQVQHMNYQSTFPLLVNVNNKPTYFLSLKDRAGLVKMYAFIDVTDYQKVVVTDAADGIQRALLNYVGRDFDEDTLKIDSIVIKKISSAVIEGNNYYFITSDDNKKYKVAIQIDEDILPFLEVNDKIKFGYTIEKDIIDVQTIITK